MQIRPAPCCPPAGPTLETLAPRRLAVRCGACGHTGPERDTKRAACVAWNAERRQRGKHATELHHSRRAAERADRRAG